MNHPASANSPINGRAELSVERGKDYYIQSLVLLVVEKITKESCLLSRTQRRAV